MREEDAEVVSEQPAERGERKGFPTPFNVTVLALDFLLKEMQKDMDEKMDVLINIQKNSKL